jgi:hypothetical protein
MNAYGYIMLLSYELIMCAYMCISYARNIIIDYDEWNIGSWGWKVF